MQNNQKSDGKKEIKRLIRLDSILLEEEIIDLVSDLIKKTRDDTLDELLKKASGGGSWRRTAEQLKSKSPIL